MTNTEGVEWVGTLYSDFAGMTNILCSSYLNAAQVATAMGKNPQGAGTADESLV